MEEGRGMATEPAKHHGFGTTLGYRIEEWRDGYGRISLELEPRHLNTSKVVHGGVIMTLMDVITGMTGAFCTVKGNRRHAMTVSLNTNFIGQAGSGRLIGIGHKTAGGRKIYFTSGEIRNAEGLVIATATGVHRYRSGSENPEGVPKGSTVGSTGG